FREHPRAKVLAAETRSPLAQDKSYPAEFLLREAREQSFPDNGRSDAAPSRRLLFHAASGKNSRRKALRRSPSAASRAKCFLRLLPFLLLAQDRPEMSCPRLHQWPQAQPELRGIHRRPGTPVTHTCRPCPLHDGTAPPASGRNSGRIHSPESNQQLHQNPC